MRRVPLGLSLLLVVVGLTSGMSVVPGDLNKNDNPSSSGDIGKSPLVTLQGLVNAGQDFADGAAHLRDETVEVLIGGKDKASDIAADFVRYFKLVFPAIKRLLFSENSCQVFPILLLPYCFLASITSRIQMCEGKMKVLHLFLFCFAIRAPRFVIFILSFFSVFLSSDLPPTWQLLR